MTSEMLPCPFCGMTGETEVDCGGSKDRWWARCYNPKCLYDVSTNIFDTEAEAIAAWNTRPAPALPEIVAAAEAWVNEAQRFPGDAYRKEAIAARDRFFSLIAAHAAEVAKVLEPFVRLHKERDDIYRKRGGNPDAFPDTHPAYDITARELPSGVWRAAADLRRRVTAALVIKLENNN